MLLTSVLRILLTRSFKPFRFEGKSHQKLQFEELNQLGLYVHIPFCRSLCSFCPYCKEIYDRSKAEIYKVALLKEIDLTCTGMTDKKQVTSLYFGGGTPALMIDELKEMIDQLKLYFKIIGGIGVELHPMDLTENNLSKLKLAGVTMISIGIQSFDKDSLSHLGRDDYTDMKQLGLISKYGFDVIDMDLIFGIPGQTSTMLIKDIKTAFGNGATQVSTYPFIDFTFSDNQYKPLAESMKKRMLKNLANYCHEQGYERTSVWTFAKQNTAKYSSVTRDAFLGFGVSATSLLKNSFKINTFSIEEYVKCIDHGLLPTALTIDFTLRQRAAYFLFWNAYSLKIDENNFKALTGKSLRKLYGVEIYIAQKAGMIKKVENGYELTEKAMYPYHYIEQVYTNGYIDKMWHIARVQAFPDEIVLH